jgi:hypothetical protein
MSEITETIKAQSEVIAKIYEAAFRNTYAKVEAFRIANPRKSVYNTYGWSGQARMAGLVTSRVDCMPGTEYLDDAKVTRYSAEAAETMVTGYALKVESKAEGMINVQVSKMDADGSFIVTGTRAGRNIKIVQSVVTKCSPKGTWFAQFPAIIYIDDKRSTEKALKALPF